MRSIYRSSTILWWLFAALFFSWSSAGAGQLFLSPDVSGGTLVGLEQPVEPVGTESLTEPPQKARDLLKMLQERDGTPLPGYVGGREFQNRERRLPRGRYREYDVNPRRRGRSRDAERIVIEQRTHKAYYTPDHYRTFIPLN